MTWESSEARGRDYEAAMLLTREARVEKMFLKDQRARELFREAYDRLLLHARCEEYGPITQFALYMTAVDVGQRAGLQKELKEPLQEGIAIFEALYPEEWKASFDMLSHVEFLRLTLFHLTQVEGGATYKVGG